MVILTGFVINWNAIGAIASAFASLFSLIAIVIALTKARNDKNERQYSVQAWFHVNGQSRMGGKANINLTILNDGVPTIKITEIQMDIGDETRELNFEYKNNKQIETGKCFEVGIINDKKLYGKAAYINIYYENIYKKKMKATSPRFQFTLDQNNNLLEIINEGFLDVPFSNQIV